MAFLLGAQSYEHRTVLPRRPRTQERYRAGTPASHTTQSSITRSSVANATRSWVSRVAPPFRRRQRHVAPVRASDRGPGASDAGRGSHITPVEACLACVLLVALLAGNPLRFSQVATALAMPLTCLQGLLHLDV